MQDLVLSLRSSRLLSTTPLFPVTTQASACMLDVLDEQWDFQSAPGGYSVRPGIRNIPQGESKKTPKFLALETGKSSPLLRAARKDIHGFVFLICPGLLARAGHIVSVSETPYESLSTKAHCLWATLRSPCLPLHHSLFFLAHPHFLACCQIVDLPLPSPLTLPPGPV